MFRLPFLSLKTLLGLAGIKQVLYQEGMGEICVKKVKNRWLRALEDKKILNRCLSWGTQGIGAEGRMNRRTKM
jgi:hypothetical protein